MKIHGFNKLTAVDFPSLLACLVFTGGCNFRCPFCHNGTLVLNPDDYPLIDNEEIFSYLEKRKGILDGVVISGGEPTINNDLIPFLERVRKTGMQIKLDTNGYRFDVLKECIENKLVDYVAMDIKNSLDLYGITIGIDNINTETIEKSIEYLLSGPVNYEFRTTVTKEFHSRESFEKIALLCRNAENYYLQNFTANENTIEKGFSPASRSELESYMEILSKTIKNVRIRNY